MAILDIYCIYWTVWDRYMQVLILGRAPRTKETLPDFLKWRRVTRPPLVFRGLTGSQRTPGFWGVTHLMPKQRKTKKKNSINLSQRSLETSKLVQNKMGCEIYTSRQCKPIPMGGVAMTKANHILYLPLTVST